MGGPHILERIVRYSKKSRHPCLESKSFIPLFLYHFMFYKLATCLIYLIMPFLN